MVFPDSCVVACADAQARRQWGSGGQDATAAKTARRHSSKIVQPVLTDESPHGNRVHMAGRASAADTPLASVQATYNLVELDRINNVFKEDPMGNLQQRSWTLQGAARDFLYLYMLREKSVDHAKEKRNAGAVCFTQTIVKQEEVCIVMMISMSPKEGVLRSSKLHLYIVGVKAFDEALCKPNSMRDTLVACMDSSSVSASSNIWCLQVMCICCCLMPHSLTLNFTVGRDNCPQVICYCAS